MLSLGWALLERPRGTRAWRGMRSAGRRGLESPESRSRRVLTSERGALESRVCSGLCDALSELTAAF